MSDSSPRKPRKRATTTARANGMIIDAIKVATDAADPDLGPKAQDHEIAVTR